MTFLVADGVVPSNEDRGYVLRRVMRRAIQHGRSLGFEPGFLVRYGELVRELMGGAYPELHEQREAIDVWLASEEEHFGRTLEQGLAVLRELIERARDGGGAVSGEDAFRLHDTFGFPIELTRELVAEEGLAVDEARLRGADGRPAPAQPRRRRRRRRGRRTARERASAFAGEAGFATRFIGYETTEQATTVGAVERANGRVLVKLADSPFYAAGGGQVSDVGVIECADGDCRRARRRGRAARRRPGARRGARAGRAARRRARGRARRPPDAPRDRVQPHGDAPAARRAAPAAGHARPPGRLLRRARQAALRLQPRRAR